MDLLKLCSQERTEEALLGSLSTPSSGAVSSGRQKCCLGLSWGLAGRAALALQNNVAGPVCLGRGNPDSHETLSWAGRLHFNKRI